MKLSKFYRWVLVLVVFGVVLATNSFAAAEKLKVYVSIVPQEYFVERIGGDRVEVKALVQPGDSPATYQPTPQQIAGLAGAELYFRIGVPFEKGFMPKVESLNSGLKVVDTRAGVKLRTMKGKHGGADNPNAVKDPHIWLNPMLVKIQAETIAEALIQADPAGKAEYTRNCQEFCADLDKLDSSLKKELKPVKGEMFMVFHPAWGYFADEYGLVQEAIELEGKNPTAKQLARLIEQAQAEQVRVIFVQPQFSKAAAENVAASIGGVVVSVNPLSRDYINNLKNVGEKIEAALSKQQK